MRNQINYVHEEPTTRTLVERREFKPAYEFQQFCIRCWFAELTIGARNIELREMYQVELERVKIEGHTAYSPSKPTALTMASATSFMLTSSSSPTKKAVDRRSLQVELRWRRTGQDDGFDTVVFPKHPDEELGEIIGVDKLTKGFASARHYEGSVVLCKQIIRSETGEREKALLFARKHLWMRPGMTCDDSRSLHFRW